MGHVDRVSVRLLKVKVSLGSGLEFDPNNLLTQTPKANAP